MEQHLLAKPDWPTGIDENNSSRERVLLSPALRFRARAAQRFRPASHAGNCIDCICGWISRSDPLIRSTMTSIWQWEQSNGKSGRKPLLTEVETQCVSTST